MPLSLESGLVTMSLASGELSLQFVMKSEKGNNATLLTAKWNNKPVCTIHSIYKMKHVTSPLFT